MRHLLLTIAIIAMLILAGRVAGQGAPVVSVGVVPTPTPYVEDTYLPLVGKIGTPAPVIVITVVVTATPIPTMTPTPSATPAPAHMVINDIVCRDPSYPADSEFFELRNGSASSITLTGWQMRNLSRGFAYTFPAYTINAGPDVYVAVYSGIGTDQPNFGELYWGHTDQLWFVGDTAELRDAAGKLVDTYTVPQSSCTY